MLFNNIVMLGQTKNCKHNVCSLTPHIVVYIAQRENYLNEQNEHSFVAYPHSWF